jgi:hypothetical protein
MSSVEAKSSIEIAAPVECVWEVMIDLPLYHEWNPFIVRVDGVSGPLTVGTAFKLHVKWSSGGGASSDEQVTRVDGPRDGRAALEYRFTGWLARLGLVRALRVQTLEPSPHGTRYFTCESFQGPLARAIPLAKVQDGFDRHARALKSRAESLQKR